jgi:UDP-2-acetamido-3-amino-2,3-dideoxy-glucuronate N-acetyltransferase
MTKIGLIGCGMWGRNLARNLAQLDVLAAVTDHRDKNAAEFAAQFNSQKRDFDAILADPSIDGVVIATSAPTHDHLAIEALQAGKHVFVEKPLSLTFVGATNIANAAEKAGRRVMVGHLIRYHAAFSELQAQVNDGSIGKLQHIQANRLAMGRIRNTESVLFDLCPHDLSLILALADGLPNKIHCAGSSHMTAGVVDYMSSFLGFENGISAGMQTSWLSPFKEHQLTVTGTAGSIVFDDTNPWHEKLTLFQDSIRLDDEYFVVDRATPVALPIAEAEPLKDEMRAFITCCQTGRPALSDIAEALNVQIVLDQMQTALIDTNHPQD